MTYREQLARQAEEFLQCHRAEKHRDGRSPTIRERPSITISRQAGAGGLKIAARLVDYLSQFDETAEHGWACFDRGLLTNCIENQSLPEARQESTTEPMEAETQIHPTVEELETTPPVHWSLFQHSADVVRRLCRLGNVIILGRGGNVLTRDLGHVFHVRLVGDESERTRQVARTLRMNPKEAQAYLDSTDRARAAYVDRHFSHDIEDPSAYHMTLNVTGLTPLTIAHIIGDSLIEWAGPRALSISA